MDKATILTHLPLAVAAFVLANSDKVRKGQSITQENIETTTAEGTWHATNFPSDGTRGVRVIFSPNQYEATSKQNRLNALIAEANKVRPVAHNRPKETDPKPVAEGIRKDAEKAKKELVALEKDIDMLTEELNVTAQSKAFTIPFIESANIILTPVETK